MAHKYRKSYRHDHDYNLDFPTNRYNHKQNDESSYLDDYSTSAISYEESIERPRSTSPYSRSEYGYETRRHSNRKKSKSPIADHDYFMQGDSDRKRSKQIRNDMKKAIYQLGIESDKNKKNEIKFRSSWRTNYYENNSFEKPEEKYEHNKYFGKAPPKYTNEGNDVEGKKKTHKRKDNQRNYNDYQVLSYKEPDSHKKIFRSKDKDRKIDSFSPEIEIGPIEYPVLGLKDNHLGLSSKDNVIYVPIVPDEKTRSHGDDKHKNQSNQIDGDTPFFNNNKNMLTLEVNIAKYDQNSNEQAVFEKTDDSLLSRNIKLNGDSNVRTSVETQTEESPIFDHNYSISKRSMGSILEKAEFKNDFAATVSKMYPTNETHQIVYKKIQDPLHDDYPVTKDYIKVSDNGSMKTKENISQTSETSAEAIILPNQIGNKKHGIDYSYLDSKKHIRSIDLTDQPKIPIRSRESSNENKDASTISENYKSFENNRDDQQDAESILKSKIHEILQNLPLYDKSNEPKIINGYEEAGLQPQHIQVLRSETVSNAFKKSKIRRSKVAPEETQSTDTTWISSTKKSSPSKLSQISSHKSIKSAGTNTQSEELLDHFKQELYDGSKSQLSMTDSKVARSNKKSIGGGRTQSFKKESKGDRQKRNTSLRSIKSQSKVEKPKKSKSILKTSSFSRKVSKENKKSVKQHDPDNSVLQNENMFTENDSWENIPEKSGSDLEDKSKAEGRMSKNKFSGLFTKSKSSEIRKSEGGKTSLSQKKSSTSKLQEKKSLTTSRSKSRNTIWSSSRHSSTKNIPKSSRPTVLGAENSQQQQEETKSLTKTHGENYSDTEQEEKKEMSDQEKRKDHLNKEEKSCECVIQYVKPARECGKLFLGTTLHDQIMDILKLI